MLSTARRSRAIAQVLSPGETTIDILVVDDDPLICALISEALEEVGYRTERVGSVQAAADLLDRRSFSLVVVDFRLPDYTGLDLLEVVTSRHPRTGVMLVTGSRDVATAVTALKSGALDYVLKPFTVQQLQTSVSQAVARNQQHWAAVEAEEKRIAERDALEAALADANETSLQLLSAALDARECETNLHSWRVSAYAVALAKYMGINGPMIDIIRRGALLHDVGKIGVRDAILLKRGPLDESEWAEMRRHAEIGAALLRRVPDFHREAELVLAHHERWDGNGYPRGLKASEIPIEARIFSVVDALDAITSDRPYRKARSIDVARSEVAASAGSQFDPDVVKAFLAMPAWHWAGLAHIVSQPGYASRTGLRRAAAS